jgi:hypothetical protein
MQGSQMPKLIEINNNELLKIKNGTEVDASGRSLRACDARESKSEES